MKILIVFGSLLGKTKRLSVVAGMKLKELGNEVKVKDVRETEINELEYFDLVILACSTWDDGQLQFDFKPFNSKLNKQDYQGKYFAVLALGGKKYPHFCYSADILEKSIESANGKLIIETLRLDFDHDEPMEKCDKEVLVWCERINSPIS